MYYIITAAIFALVGFIVGYFVMRNNPKYFDLDDMAKAKRDELLKKVEEYKKKIGH